MEKSIKRVERLVHVTNSALAQMKFSLMFDDMNEDGNGNGNGKIRDLKGFDPIFGEKFRDGDDLKLCQNEFKSEANEMLAKLERMCPPDELLRKNSKAVDRIKEINRKMNSLKSEQSNREETEQSRKKLLNLINEEKYSPKDSVQSKRGRGETQKKSSEPKRTDSVTTLSRSPNKSKEELKSKILETQDIVNRGFETARQLAQKVETMSKCERKETTPRPEKTVREVNLMTRSSEGKTEGSNESGESRKCRKCSKERRRRRKVAEKDDQLNAKVIEVEGEELQRWKKTNLRLQRLPSLHIRGGLQLQKVHMLEIPAGGDGSSPKSNTAINFLSHEEMQYEKMGEDMEKVRKENCGCTRNNPRGNYVECFNCGKLNRVRESWVDPRKVDEILKKCNYDVFDPRIDEFVEKCRSGSVKWCKKQAEDPETTNTASNAATIAATNAATIAGTIAATDAAPEAEPKETKETARKMEETPKKTSVKRFIDQVFKKYKQETETMESNHEKLDNILQNLFKQVDESREVFEKCHFFKNQKPTPTNLTVTKPVLVSLTENAVKPKRKYRRSDKQQMNRIVEMRKDDLSVEEASRFRKSTEKDKTRRISVNVKEKTKEEIRRVVALSSSSERLSEGRKVDQGEMSEMSSSTSKSWSSDRVKNGKEDVAERQKMKYRHSKPTDHVLKRDETLRTDTKSRKQPADTRIEEKAASDTSSSSRRSRRKTGENRNGIENGKTPELFQALFSKPTSVEMEKKIVDTPKSEGKTSSESSSENNYESDFESTTNEPNDMLEECEEDEQEVKESMNKLSTISEVDSELEKKVSDEQATGRSSQNAEMEDSPKNTKKEEKELLKEEKDVHKEKKEEKDVHKEKKEEKDVHKEKKEENSGSLETSSDGKSKKTEVTSAKTAEESVKSTPTELVTSLKDILTALQNQFVRTESLAEKLTESVKWEGPGKTEPGMPLLGDVMLSTWKKPIAAELVENLRSARKDTGRGGKSPGKWEKSTSERRKKTAEEMLSGDSLSDEGGSSLGEIVVSDRRRRRKSSEKSNSGSISECSFLRLDTGRKSARAPSSNFKIDVNSEEEVLYSEGEIPSEELLSFERFTTNSIGEVISEKNSPG